MRDLTSKQKGNLLEKIVGQLCSGIKNAKTESNVKLLGKSGTERQIDVFIKGNVGAFEVKILVDSKNHSAPIDIKEVQSSLLSTQNPFINNPYSYILSVYTHSFINLLIRK